MAFHPRQSYDPVPRVQVKEILEHTFEGVIDEENKLEICINGKFFICFFLKIIILFQIHLKDQFHFNVLKMTWVN